MAQINLTVEIRIKSCDRKEGKTGKNGSIEANVNVNKFRNIHRKKHQLEQIKCLFWCLDWHVINYRISSDNNRRAPICIWYTKIKKRQIQKAH